MAPGEFRLRVRYAKRGRLAYLAHLELLDAVQRMIVRAGLPYAITQGFSPRMKIAFSSALPVGTASDDEYVDVTLTAYEKAEAYRERLQAVSGGIEVLEAGYVPEKDPSLGAALTIGVYEAVVTTELPVDEITDRIDAVRERGYIEFERKKKLKRTDLAKTLVDVAAPEITDDGRVLLRFTTRALPEGSLRPDLLIGSIFDGSPYRVSLTRRAQYIEGDDGSWIPPLTA